MSVSAINALRSQSLKSADFKQPASVMAAINNAFLMEDHNNKFFTMWYGVYNRLQHTLTYASAAHPPAFIRTGDTTDKTELLELTTGNLAIGYMQDMVFKASLELKQFNQLTVYSDGVYEIEKSNGEMVTLLEYTDIMKGLTDIKATHVDSILKTMQGLQAEKGPFEDDFSLLQVNIHRG
jgi:sigma-B regulation protein RsbU (phosphoserine phosphatase)